MIDPVVIDALVASGCTPEQIAAVVKADFVAEQARAEAKREYERNRKRNYRAGKSLAGDAHNNVSHDVPGTLGDKEGHEGTDGDNAKTVSLSPIPLLPPTPPNNPLTPNPIQKPNSARGFRLPEDWSLTGPDLAFALSKGYSEAQIAEIFEKFTNYWWSATGAKATKKNWHQAWKVWVLNTRPQSRAGPAGFAKPLTEHQRKQQETRDVLAALGSSYRNRESGSGAIDRVLSLDSSQQPADLRRRIGSDVCLLPGISDRGGN